MRRRRTMLCRRAITRAEPAWNARASRFATVSSAGLTVITPAADTRASLSTRLGWLSAVSAAMKPPIELPTSVVRSTPISPRNASRNRP
jgi:hypothetical protein